MISNLQIENVAIIKKAVIDFKDGFNVMTGETGAGKSIIIDSLNAVLGERTSRDLIRTNCEFASVSALFFDKSEKIAEILKEFDIETEEDGSILISRKMSADGKNSCKVNGVNVTVSMLKKLGKELVNIHGQSDNQALLNPEYHCEFIDSIAENKKVFEVFTASYNDYISAKRKLEALNVDESEKIRRLEILNYQIDEIEKASISVGEWDELRKQQEFYRNAEKICEALNISYSFLNGSDDAEGAVSLTFSANNKLNNVSDVSEEIESLAKRLENCAYTLSDLSDELREMLDSLDFNEADINSVEERLEVLYELSKKYGKTEEDIIEYYNRATEERDGIENSDELRNKLEKQVKELYNTAFENAKELSRTRIYAGNLFSKNVCESLKFLDMPSVKFYVDIRDCDLCENGIDTVEFFLSANAGEEPKPLHKIASGGELSRIMLAIKSVLAEKDNIPTLVFDEIDTGVSGSAAQKIALKLKEVSKSHQVICVTHLAQIAAYADEHMLISKSEKDGQTYTELISLDFEQRKYELARIMGGISITDLMLENAEQMLVSAQNYVDK